MADGDDEDAEMARAIALSMEAAKVRTPYISI
jgi:hypothetical protein